jgi:hypothetical protein
MSEPTLADLRRRRDEAQAALDEQQSLLRASRSTTTDGPGDDADGGTALAMGEEQRAVADALQRRIDELTEAIERRSGA